MGDKSTVAKVVDAQVKDDFFGDVVKRIILNNVMNRLHDDEIETFSILLNSNSWNPMRFDLTHSIPTKPGECFALLEIFRDKFIQNLPQNAKFDTLLIQIMTMKLLRNQNKSTSLLIGVTTSVYKKVKQISCDY